MKIIIVENEIYLAQSIQNNLSDKLKANCYIYSSLDEAITKDADIFIINPNVSGNINNFIEEKKEKIIILLVPYVSYSNVTHPLSIGADDYLQKPFSIEDLIRKINHLVEYYKLKEKVKSLENLIEFLLKDIKVKIPNYYFPLYVKHPSLKVVEKFSYEIAKRENSVLEIIDLMNLKDLKLSKDKVYLCLNFEKSEEDLSILEKYKTIIYLKDSEKAIKIEAERNTFIDEILSIEEYVKFIIKTYQNKYPDTILSKKLGISRKSLWEKRKKYGIFKQK